MNISPVSPLIPPEGDGFKMKPLSIGCKSQWKIDCLVASCSTDLQFENPEMYSQYCKGWLSNSIPPSDWSKNQIL